MERIEAPPGPTGRRLLGPTSNRTLFESLSVAFAVEVEEWNPGETRWLRIQPPTLLDPSITRIFVLGDDFDR